jgi:class 3 adenylate cyclase
MSTGADSTTESYLSQLRLLLEELCCDLRRFEHFSQEGLSPEAVRIDRECFLGTPGAFADIRVTPDGRPPYFMEVKFGYTDRELVVHLGRKYGSKTPATSGASKLILVVDTRGRSDWKALEAEIRASLRPGLALEVWHEKRLLALLRDQFHIDVPSVDREYLLDVRQAIEQAKARHAFGDTAPGAQVLDPLKAELLWHFGFWRLRQLREAKKLSPTEILPPGMYPGVVVLMADLCSFSSYVRDTREDAVIRHCLTSFYSKARYRILNSGGMFYQFVGDEVIGLFGIPDNAGNAAAYAIDAATGLLDIGNSVSNHWQRHIDRVQQSSGLHIGMAVGDLQIVALRPFSRTHVGAIGDALNVAARLTVVAGPSEIVISNSLYNEFDEATQGRFSETDPVEAHNIGRIKAWRFGLRDKPR